MRSLLGSLVSRHAFAGIFRSWGSMAMLMPVGGEGIWGNGSDAPDEHHLGHMLTFARPPTPPPRPSTEGEDASSKPHAAKGIVSNAAAPRAAQAAAKAAAHASEPAAAAIAAATLAVKSGTNPADDSDVQRATEASEALAVSKAKQEAIAAEESLRASAKGATASALTSSSSRRASTHESSSIKKPGAPPLEPNGLSEARRKALLGLDSDDFYSDVNGDDSENFDNDSDSSKSANDSNGSCINGSSDNGTCGNAHDNASVMNNYTKNQQQPEHVNQIGLTATGALSLLREVAPHYGELFDANYDFRGRLEMQGKGNKKFWRPRASKRAPTSDPKASASPAAAAAGEGKGGRVKPWRAGAGSSTSWHNPLARPLPPAPGLTMYCFHGTGLPTDRAYVLSGARDYHDEDSSSQPPSHPSAPSPAAREDGDENSTNGSGEGSDVTTNISSDSSTSAANMISTVASSSGSADTYQNTLPFEVDVSAHDPSNGLHHGVS